MFSISSTIARSARLPAPAAAAATRTLRTTALARTERDPAKPNSQGHAVRKSGQTLEGGMDVQSAGVKAGFAQSREGKSSQAEPYDTAAEDGAGQAAPSRQKADALRDASSASQAAHSAGAFKDHRGGAQSSGEVAGNVGNKQEAAAPSVTSTVKQALGLGTSKKEHQESKTGPGVSRQMHTSARRAGEAYEGSTGDGAHKTGKPEERLTGEQNEHLKHKQAGQADNGKGNAADTPHLPSKTSGARTATDLRTDADSQRKARFHTSARQTKDAPGGYVRATENPAKAAGYDTPGEALPSADMYPNKLPAADDLTPSSALPHSTTAGAPRHPVTGDQARDGTLADRNPPPLTSEAGEIGLNDAWKKRNAELKGQ
ncbi:hypothetical protein NliqN6_1308 [Naganishia liquefaciens]|uniref:Uncharacterized protein n=1 Tax=Naganishia liquefaciens TaxID=104408 RepID=A0A8H3TQ52_9TREE|nr:hypothetical protein NliqN6_1308 [Naganishia liquefaciens]